MRLLKPILPPNELVYMLTHWFGKSREEVRAQMLKHGFVSKKKPDTAKTADVVAGTIPPSVVSELYDRLQKSGHDSESAGKMLASAGMRPTEMEHLTGTKEVTGGNAYSVFEKIVNHTQV